MLCPARKSGLIAHVPVGVYMEGVSVEEVVNPILRWQGAGEALDSRLDRFNGDIGKSTKPRAQDSDVVPFAAVGDDALPHMLAVGRGRADQRGPDTGPAPPRTERGMSPRSEIHGC